jgi:drug/metabolite transporter (DMT)-like permease
MSVLACKFHRWLCFRILGTTIYHFRSGQCPVFDFNAIFSLFYLSLVGTAIAFAVYFWMLKNTPAVVMSMITFVTPPLALFWGWLLMSEHISIFLIIGMILIFVGIYIARKKDPEDL